MALFPPHEGVNKIIVFRHTRYEPCFFLVKKHQPLSHRLELGICIDEERSDLSQSIFSFAKQDCCIRNLINDWPD